MNGRGRVWMSGRLSNSRGLRPYLSILAVMIIVLIMEVIDSKRARSCVLCPTSDSMTSHTDLGFNVVLLKPSVSSHGASRGQIAIPFGGQAADLFSAICHRLRNLGVHPSKISASRGLPGGHPLNKPLWQGRGRPLTV
jgi:hypothetical protein